jgi:4-amino-4-deoxy-L-arabinose transferase-like glycosyltransferase
LDRHRLHRARRLHGVAELKARGPAAAALAVVAAAPLLLAGLGAVPFDDPGEGMHAEIARELAHHGLALPLTLVGVPYLDKPPLLYALLAAAFSTLGPSEGSARLVSAIAALIAVGATAWLGARLGGPGMGLVAGLALLGSIGFFAYGRYVRPDALFVAALAVGFALALSGLADGRPGRVAVGLTAFGAAALAKDPLGALAPPLALGLAMALAGRARPVSRWLPWPGLLAAAVLAFGWWAWAEAATPGYVWYTVVDNHVLNVAGARHFPDEDVPLSAIEFAAVALLGAAPWVVPAAGVVVAQARRRAWREPAEVAWTALALGATGVLAATALVAFRLPHYGLPAYPAVALLAARGWRDLSVRWLAVAHAVLLGTLGLACAIAWTGDGAAFLGGVLEATDVATRKSALAGLLPAAPPWTAFRPLVGAAAIALLTGGLVVAAAAVARARALALGATILTLVALLPSVAGALRLVSAHRAVKGIAEEIRQRAGSPDLVVHEGPIENAGALEWYSGRRPVIVDGRRSVLGFVADRPETREAFWDEPALARAWSGPARVWLVTGRPAERSAIARLSGARLVAASGGRRLYVNR